MTPSVCAPAGTDAAHAVTQVDAIGAAGALDRPVMDREDDAVAAAERHDLGARLHARPLLGQHDSPPVKSRPGSESGNATWSGNTCSPTEVLVLGSRSRSRAGLQQQPGRLRLPGRVACGQGSRAVLGRIATVGSRTLRRACPSACDRGEPARQRMASSPRPENESRFSRSYGSARHRVVAYFCISAAP